MRAVLGLVLIGLLWAAPARAQNPFVRLQHGNAVPTAIDANDDVVMIADAEGLATLWIQVTGTYDGTLTPQCSLDGTNFDGIPVSDTTDGTVASEISADTGIWTASINCNSVRVIGSSWDSGTAMVTMQAIQTGGSSQGGGTGGGLTDAELRADPVEVAVTSGGATQVTTGSSGGSTGNLGMCIWDDAVFTDSVTDSQNARLRCGDYGLHVGATIVDPTTGDAVDLTPEPCSVRANISTVVISTASSGNNLLVTVGASQLLYVCSWYGVATAAVAVQLIAGTGSACATNELNLTGAMPFAANGGIVESPSYTKTTIAGDDLCIELGGNVQFDGALSYELITP